MNDHDETVLAEGWARMAPAIRQLVEQHHANEHRFDGGLTAARCPIGFCGEAKRTVAANG